MRIVKVSSHLGLLLLYGLMGCSMPTAAQQQTCDPRPGCPLPVRCERIPDTRCALVYSYASEINLLGLENLHPGDIHRQGKTFNELIRIGAIEPDDVYVPTALTDEQLAPVHDAAYLQSLGKSGNVAKVLESPSIGLLADGLCRQWVVRPFRVSTGGTVLAAELAMREGLAINLGGGFQHAFRDRGEGFCMFADVPLAIHLLREKKPAARTLIVDCDIHQENGFASYYVDDPDTRILDIYEEHNYPYPKVRESNPQPIPHGISEADYLALLARELPPLLDSFKPDAVFYVAGNDPFEGDALGHAKLSADGLVRRDLYVIAEARRRKIPTVMVLAGGYSPQSWRITFRTVATILTGSDPQQQPLGKSAEQQAGR